MARRKAAVFAPTWFKGFERTLTCSEVLSRVCSSLDLVIRVNAFWADPLKVMMSAGLKGSVFSSHLSSSVSLVTRHLSGIVVVFLNSMVLVPSGRVLGFVMRMVSGLDRANFLGVFANCSAKSEGMERLWGDCIASLVAALILCSSVLGTMKCCLIASSIDRPFRIQSDPNQ